MRQFKMVAIDLDGTLLDPSSNVSERSRVAVRRALDAGILICFATGRNWTESKPILDAVAHYDCAVFVGGAMVVDTKNEVALHRMLMDPALAREVSGFFEDRGQGVMAVQDVTTSGGIDYVISGDAPLHPSTEYWISHAKIKVERFPRLSEFGHEHTARVSIVGDRDVTDTVAAEMVEHFGQRIVTHSIYVASGNVNIVEVFDPAVNKWQGILKVAERHNILASEIIAIGDDMNDLPMLREAGLGVAMGNARPEAKAVAKRVIGSNREEGLAAFLDELVTHHTVQPLSEVDGGETNV
ncbi:MAG TPA: HAD family hydrolase [Tepidisphaeraceae bacterium]|jgi:hypothetical protein|nr:HAD family hydrolase [Tepidisphaeraceae bacterium]